MPQESQANNYNKVFFQWLIPEYAEYKRTNLWYLVMILIAIGLVVYSIATVNFLFALIIILATFIILLRIYTSARQIKFRVTDKGFAIGNEFFKYRQVKDFYIIYNPPETKKLFINFNGLRPDIAVPLADQDPVELRKKLLDHLEEDLEKEEESLGEQLENFLKM